MLEVDRMVVSWWTMACLFSVISIQSQTKTIHSVHAQRTAHRIKYCVCKVSYKFHVLTDTILLNDIAVPLSIHG